MVVKSKLSGHKSWTQIHNFAFENKVEINPIKPLKGKLKRASYQSSLSPEEVLSYQISASFEGEEIPRIGLRGTAKIYGSRVTLFYYLFRKPITFVRQLIGV